MQTRKLIGCAVLPRSAGAGRGECHRELNGARRGVGVYGGRMKRTALVTVLMIAAVSLEGCWLWPFHRRTTITANDVRPPPPSAAPVGARQH